MKFSLAKKLFAGIVLFAGVSFLLTTRYGSSNEKVPKSYGWTDVSSQDLTTRRILYNDLVSELATEEKYHRPPDFLGIGVRKCGTGALHWFLKIHPLLLSNRSEVHYYDKDIDMGIEYYKHILPAASKRQMVTEKTPAYFTSMPHNLPEIIKRDSPNVKLLLMLCNPVDRAFSDYVMRLKSGSKMAQKPFSEYMEEFFEPVKEMFNSLSMHDDDATVGEVIKELKKKRSMYSFAHGVYAYFIRRWLKVFKPDQIMIINGEQFLNDPGTVIERIQKYLNVPKILHKNDFVRHPVTGLFCSRPWWNETYEFLSELKIRGSWSDIMYCPDKHKGYTRRKGEKRHVLEWENAHKLQQFYEPYNEILYGLIGERFEWTLGGIWYESITDQSQIMLQSRKFRP